MYKSTEVGAYEAMYVCYTHLTFSFYRYISRLVICSRKTSLSIKGFPVDVLDSKLLRYSGITRGCRMHNIHIYIYV